METAINLQLLLPQYPLLFWKPWLFQASQTLAGVGTAVFNHGALVSMVTAHDQSPASFRCLLQGSKHCICYSFISPTWVFFKPCVYQCLEMSLLGWEGFQQLASFLLSESIWVLCWVQSYFCPAVKVLLPFSWDNLQIIQTILCFYHLSAYAHLPKSDSPDHYMYLVALPHCSELLQAVFGLPISHASPFPWDCTHQNTHVHHNQIQHDETQHLSNVKQKRLSEVSKLQVTLCPNGFPEPSSNSEMFLPRSIYAMLTSQL